MDKNNPYERFTDKELILRDQLAIDRTILANERTMLAYMRTGLALMITGAGCIQLYQAITGLIIGILLIAGGAVIMIIGFRRHHFMNKIIRSAGTKPTEQPKGRLE